MPRPREPSIRSALSRGWITGAASATSRRAPPAFNGSRSSTRASEAECAPSTPGWTLRRKASSMSAPMAAMPGWPSACPPASMPSTPIGASFRQRWLWRPPRRSNRGDPWEPRRAQGDDPSARGVRARYRRGSSIASSRAICSRTRSACSWLGSRRIASRRYPSASAGRPR